MDNKVILLGSGPGANAIRSALIDYTSLGLIPELLWVNPDRDGNSVEYYEHNSAEGLQEGARGLADVVRDTSSVLLVALDDIEDEGSYLNEVGINRWANLVHQANVKVERLHLLLSRLPLISKQIAPVEGWSSLVLAAEDSDSPTSPQSVQHRSEGPAELARYAAPAVAGLAGLWEGVQTAPVLEDIRSGALATENGRRIRLVRVFHRRIDASDIEAQVRESALDVRSQIPQPATSKGKSVAVAVDSGEVIRGITERFSTIAAGDLFEPYVPDAKLDSVKVNAWDEFKGFMSFFFRAVVGTPGDWGRSAKSSGQSAFARTMQNVLYGEDSKFEVVCGQHSGKNNTFTVAEMNQVSQQFREELAKQNTTEFRVGAPPQLGPMWLAYQECALTLVDGEHRAQARQLAPIDSADGTPTILRKTSESIADPSDAFDGSHAVLDAQFGKKLMNTTIAPFDPYSADNYERFLNHATRQSADRGLSRKAEEYREWKAQNSQSFAWALADRLRQFIAKANEDVRRFRAQFEQIQKELRELSGDDPTVDQRLLRAMRSITFGWLFLIIIMIYLVIGGYKPSWKIHGSMPELSWWMAIILGLILTALALVTEWLMFAKARRGLYERVQRLELLRKQEEITAKNLSLALGAVERTTNAYAQHQAWNHIIGRAINYPYGVDTVRTAPIAIPSGGLPRATVIGRAKTSDLAISHATQRLRNNLYEIGWAEQSLQRLIDDANAELNVVTDQQHGRQDYVGMLGLGTGSQLDKLVQCAENDSLARSVDINDAWTQCLHNSAGLDNTQDLTARMETWEDDGAREVNTSEVLSSFTTQASGNEFRAAFANDSVNPAAIHEGATEIDEKLSKVVDSAADSHGGQGFSRSVTLIQYGKMTTLDSLVAIQ